MQSRYKTILEPEATARIHAVLTLPVWVCLLALLSAGCLDTSAQTVGASAAGAQQQEPASGATTEEDFVPSEEVSADRSVSFPVDI